jgi:hypothetical protein
LHPLFGGGVSCQFIWFVALLIVLTAGSGVLAYLILGSDLYVGMCFFHFLLAFILSPDLLLPSANASELGWAFM